MMIELVEFGEISYGHDKHDQMYAALGGVIHQIGCNWVQHVIQYWTQSNLSFFF